MARQLHRVKIAPKGMGLNDFVAMQEGYFAAERLLDFSKFGRGERFVYEAIPRSEFDEVMEQVKRWGLDQYLKDKSFEGLAADLSAGAAR
jgi:hypothetical protein